MFCPKCGHPVKAADEYCEECGYPLKTAQEPPKEEVKIKYCPHCGRENSDWALACPYCGTAFPSDNAQPNAPAPQKEKTNGMAIAGFVCSFFVPILGWIFGGIGLSKSKHMNGKGKGFAIAAIAISCATYICQLVEEIYTYGIGLY